MKANSKIIRGANLISYGTSYYWINNVKPPDIYVTGRRILLYQESVGFYTK